MLERRSGVRERDDSKLADSFVGVDPVFVRAVERSTFNACAAGWVVDLEGTARAGLAAADTPSLSELDPSVSSLKSTEAVCGCVLLAAGGKG